MRWTCRPISKLNMLRVLYLGKNHEKEKLIRTSCWRKRRRANDTHPHNVGGPESTCCHPTATCGLTTPLTICRSRTAAFIQRFMEKRPEWLQGVYFSLYQSHLKNISTAIKTLERNVYSVIYSGGNHGCYYITINK